MDASSKLKLWLLPAIGLVLGVIYAYMWMHGLISAWHLVGNPGEPIASIIGVVDQKEIFVSTDSGKVFSIEYKTCLDDQDYLFDFGSRSISEQVIWTGEGSQKIKPDRLQPSGVDFMVRSGSFEEKQRYDIIEYSVDAERLTRFALSEDGDLWMWSYALGGKVPLKIALYAFLGLIAGLLAALLVKITASDKWKKPTG